MTPRDLRLMHEWLQREHVRKWWSRHGTYAEVVEHYLPALEGRKPTDLYLILLDDREIGFIQTYLAADFPEWAQHLGETAGVAGVDLFIADEELIGMGIGSEALRAFTRDVVFARAATLVCVADPDARNTASIRAFEKAGFRQVGEFFDPSDRQSHALVRLERPSGPRLRSSAAE
jgi:RimJ/RimL family protein N-acetyltransferase